MDKKILFFDIDGTLLVGYDPGYIPESAIYALKKAQEKGHYVLINSGRTFSYFPAAVKSFPFDGYVCGCGTQVLFQGKELFHASVADSLISPLLRLLKECRIQGVLEGAGHVYMDKDLPPMPLMARIIENCRAYGSDILKDFTDPDLCFDKLVILYDDRSDLASFRAGVKDHFQFIAGFAPGVSGYAELVPHPYTKASGIDVVTKHTGISPDNCYVFGDGVNDLPMLTHVKHSIVMGNSHPDVFPCAEYITTPVSRDGILLALKHYQII